MHRALRLAVWIGVIAVVAIAAVELWDAFEPRSWRWPRLSFATDYEARITGLSQLLGELGISASAVQRTRPVEVATGRSGVENWAVRLPRRLSLVECNLAVTRRAPRWQLAVLDVFEHETRGPDGQRSPAITMVLGEQGSKPSVLSSFFANSGAAPAEAEPPSERFRLTFEKSPPDVVGQVAVVIDDFGHAWDETARAFLGFPAPLTLAVLPHRPGSATVADLARQVGFEVLLHMPMEPQGYPRVDPGDDAILVDDRAIEVRARLRRAFRSVGDVRGISNHMGSLATADPDIMKIVLEETGDRSLYFVDSATTPRSVVGIMARRLGVPFLENRLFLDDVKEADAIRQKMSEAMRIAEKLGAVLVIGHAYPETHRVLIETLDELAERRLELVTASNLLPPTGVLTAH